MSPPRAVVIPFGVPTEGRGLGIGLAALVHGFAQLEGQGVALAQLQQRSPEGDGPSAKGPDQPVEAFVPPSAWRDLAGRGGTPADVTIVVTGALEPPGEGRGALQVLVFDAKDGSTRAKIDTVLDEQRAGEGILERALGFLVAARRRARHALGHPGPRLGRARERPPRRALRAARSDAWRAA